MYICGYALGFFRERASNDIGVDEERNFHGMLLAICSETSDRIYINKIYIQDIQLFDGFSVVPKCMTLNESE